MAKGHKKALEKDLEAASAGTVEDLVVKLREALKGVSKKKMEEAKEKALDFASGDLKWTELFSYSPEQLREVAELGYQQFQGGNYESAEKLFKGLSVIEPDNYYYYQMLGATYQNREMYPEALLEYSLAIDSNPKDIVSLTNRGEVFLKLGLHDFAYEDLGEAIRLDPQGKNPWGNRARALEYQVGRLDNKGH